MKYYIYEASIQGKKRYFISLLEPEIVYKMGLKTQVIMGEIKRTEKIDWQEFIPNDAFIQFFHKIVSREALLESGCIALAKRKGSGWIYLVDNRVKDKQDKTDKKDIIGSYRVENGQIVEGSYNANPKYCVISEDGFFNLPRGIKNVLLKELRLQLK